MCVVGEIEGVFGDTGEGRLYIYCLHYSPPLCLLSSGIVC